MTDIAPVAFKRNVFHAMRAPYGLTSVQAGQVDAVHDKTLEAVRKQLTVQVEGQTDIVTLGVPYLGPYNVNSAMNPILVVCMGLGYLFNFYRNKPVLRKGGRSEERRVGKECRSRWWAETLKKKGRQ